MSRLIKGDGVNFTQIPNEILYSDLLSFRDKGIYAYFLAKPDSWKFSTERIVRETKEGIKSIRAGINSLIEIGLLHREKLSDGAMQYTIYLSIEDSKKPKCQNGTVPKRHCAKTAPIINKDNLINKEISKNTYSKRESFKKFKERFIKSATGKTVSFTTTGIGYLKDTQFALDNNNYIVNLVNNRILNKDDAFKVWQYLYDNEVIIGE